MKTQTEICGAFDDAQKRLSQHGFAIRSNSQFGLVFEGNLVSATDTVDGLTAFVDALDFAAARSAMSRPMKTEVESFKAFDAAQPRLAAHGLTIHTNGVFGLKAGDDVVCLTDSVSGLTAFADALDFAASRARDDVTAVTQDDLGSPPMTAT